MLSSENATVNTPNDRAWLHDELIFDKKIFILSEDNTLFGRGILITVSSDFVCISTFWLKLVWANKLPYAGKWSKSESILSQTWRQKTSKLHNQVSCSKVPPSHAFKATFEGRILRWRMGRSQLITSWGFGGSFQSGKEQSHRAEEHSICL